MLQTLSTTGALTFANAFPILLGIFLGDHTITTAPVCSAGAQANAKRTGVVTDPVQFGLPCLFDCGCPDRPRFRLINALRVSTMNSGSIANVNTISKLISTLVFVPFRTSTQETIPISSVSMMLNQKNIQASFAQ